MKISNMANKIHPSLTRRLFDKAKQYENVIDFTLGDPDYDTPENIKNAGCRAIMAGKTHYSANAGLPELRQVISDRIYREDGVRYDPNGEILVSVGAMEGLYLSLCCLINPGDEVIIPAPYWINYEHMVLMCGGVPVIVDSDEEHEFIVELENIKNSVTDKTVAIIVNSPNNPTGTIYDRNTICGLCELARDKDITIIWDECYKTIVYDDAEYASILEVENIKDNVVIIDSCSKKYSMTGWRIGYVAAPRELIAAMTKLQENVAACASLPSQYAAIAALSGDDAVTEELKCGFEKRRDVLIEEIRKIKELSCNIPKGTFYAFINIKTLGIGSEEFAYALLESKQVAVVPGITYGQCCEGYIRIAFTLNEDKIKDGIKRIAEFCAEVKK